MQIIGRMKCRDTKKCRLWFDQRGIKYHFVDLEKRDLSQGEWQAVATGRNWDDLIDRSGKAWEKHQLAWKDYNPRDELMDDSALLKTPVLREGRMVAVGYDPGAWEKVLQMIKSGGEK